MDGEFKEARTLKPFGILMHICCFGIQWVELVVVCVSLFVCLIDICHVVINIECVIFFSQHQGSIF